MGEKKETEVLEERQLKLFVHAGHRGRPRLKCTDYIEKLSTLPKIRRRTTEGDQWARWPEATTQNTQVKEERKKKTRFK